MFPTWLLLVVAVVGAVGADPANYRSAYSLQPSPAYRGVAYSAFLHEGPEPEGHHEPLVADNIERDMKLLQQLGVRWIRTYATDLNGSLIPPIAKRYGINTFIGTWVNTGEEGVAFWRQELARAEELFKQDNQLVPIIIVGNELAYTKKQPMETVMRMVQEAKDKGFYVALGDIPPSFLDPSYIPLWQMADILLVHSHPYFSHIRTAMGARVMGTRLLPDAAGADDVVQATMKIAETYPNKVVMIGETGYPSEDDSPVISPAKCRWCNDDNQRHFIESLFHLADTYKVGVFAFEAFDEHWKGDVGEEAGSGPHWGFFDADRNPKPAAEVVARWAQLAASGAPLPPPAHACDYLQTQAECRPKPTAEGPQLQAALDFVCNEGVVDCEELSKNPLLRPCPLAAKASWALTKYFHQNLWRDSACDFNGTAGPHFADDFADQLRASTALQMQAALQAPRVEARSFVLAAPGPHRRPSPSPHRLLAVLLTLTAVAGLAAAWEARTGGLSAVLRRARFGAEYSEV